MEADGCFIQAADDRDSAGLWCFAAVPLAGFIKDILDRGCVGEKQAMARCSIKLSSGKCGEN